MKLIVGLGNPGKEYEKNRHNVGFMTIDNYVNKENLGSFKEGYFGEYIKTKINSEDIIFYKPFTFMNDSGRGVIAIVNFFKINISDILVIHDDLDLGIGFVRLRKNGSSGGHNGIKSIIANLGTEQFKRLRIGIDKPKFATVVDYVLGNFTKEEKELIDKAIEISRNAINEWTKSDFDIVMSKYNTKK